VESGQLLPQPAALLSLLSADENHGGNNHAAVSLQTREAEAHTLQVVLDGKIAARERGQALVGRRNPKRPLFGVVCRKRTPTVGRRAGRSSTEGLTMDQKTVDRSGPEGRRVGQTGE
jgi:hypothetical protein